MPAEIDGWGEYRKLILSELERLSAEVANLGKKLDGDLGAMKVEMAMLKVKAGLWGTLTGAGAGLLAAIAAYLAAK